MLAHQEVAGSLEAVTSVRAESFSLSDRDSTEISSADRIEFKETIVWQTAYQQLKQLLAHREHITRHKIR